MPQTVLIERTAGAMKSSPRLVPESLPGGHDVGAAGRRPNTKPRRGTLIGFFLFPPIRHARQPSSCRRRRAAEWNSAGARDIPVCDARASKRIFCMLLFDADARTHQREDRHPAAKRDPSRRMVTAHRR